MGYVVRLILDAIFEFKFHYAFDAKEVYIPEKVWEDLKYEVEILGELQASSGMEIFGMALRIHDGPIMLIRRRGNTAYRWINGKFDHAVVGDEQCAIWKEVPAV